MAFKREFYKLINIMIKTSFIETNCIKSASIITIIDISINNMLMLFFSFLELLLWNLFS
jgi:hypothetical protein